jgi:mRNA interferase RelE/StbE
MNSKIYQVKWTNEALKELHKLDKTNALKIKQKVDEFLAKNPRGNNTKPLSHEWKGYWRLKYRFYRIIYKIFDSEILISVTKVAHRREVYD